MGSCHPSRPRYWGPSKRTCLVAIQLDPHGASTCSARSASRSTCAGRGTAHGTEHFDLNLDPAVHWTVNPSFRMDLCLQKGKIQAKIMGSVEQKTWNHSIRVSECSLNRNPRSQHDREGWLHHSNRVFVSSSPSTSRCQSSTWLLVSPAESALNCFSMLDLEAF